MYVLSVYSVYVYIYVGELFAGQQSREEIEERAVVLLESENSVGIGKIDSGTGEIQAGDVVAGGLQKRYDLLPAPGAMACTMDEHKMHLGFSFSSLIITQYFLPVT